MDKDFLKEMQVKIALELNKKEKEVLTYWLEEFKKILLQKHHNLASQSNAVSELIKRMETRLNKV